MELRNFSHDSPMMIQRDSVLSALQLRNDHLFDTTVDCSFFFFHANIYVIDCQPRAHVQVY